MVLFLLLVALLGNWMKHQGINTCITSVKQPDLNWENEELRHQIYDMMNFPD